MKIINGYGYVVEDVTGTNDWRIWCLDTRTYSYSSYPSKELALEALNNGIID